MSKYRVPFSWVSRLILGKTPPLKPTTSLYPPPRHYPIVVSSSPFLFHHNPCHQARHFCMDPEEDDEDDDAVFQLLAEVERQKKIEREAKRKAGIAVDENEEEEDDFMGVDPLIEKLDKEIAKDEKKQYREIYMSDDEDSESESEDDDDDEDRAEEMWMKEEQLLERKFNRHQDLIKDFTDTDNLDEAYKRMAKLDRFEEKHINLRPEYRVIGELMNRFKEATGKDKFLLAQKLNRAMRLVQQREAFDTNNPANFSIIQREEVGPSAELLDDADVENEKDAEDVVKDEEDEEDEEEFDDMKERDDILLQKLSVIDKQLEEKLATLDHTFGKKGKLLEEEIRDLAEERNSLTEKKRVPMYRRGFDVHLIDMNRTCKVTKGGQVVKYTAILACGNYNGVVGYAKAKGPAVPIALQKAYEKCFQNLHHIDRYEDHTIAHAIQTTYKKTKVYLWPARTTTGMKAGRTVQTILNLAGFKNIKSKVIGSRNPHNTVKALFKALNAIETPKDVQEKMGRTVVESYLL